MAAQKADKKIAVKVTLDDTVYIVSGQGLYKTYINRIVAKQWFNENNEIVQQITYEVPSSSISSDISNKFVLDDFGNTIFTNINSAQKKFDSISKYGEQYDTFFTGEGIKDVSKNAETYISEGKKKIVGKGSEALEETKTVESLNDINGYCDGNCFSCTLYDKCNKNIKRLKSINTGTGKEIDTSYIKVTNSSGLDMLGSKDIPQVPAKKVTSKEILNSINKYKTGFTYYDSRGVAVTNSSENFNDASTFDDAVGNVYRVQYRDNSGKLIFRIGISNENIGNSATTISKGSDDYGNYVYEDGTFVPVNTKVYKIVELVGATNTGKSNIASSAKTKDIDDIVDTEN